TTPDVVTKYDCQSELTSLPWMDAIVKPGVHGGSCACAGAAAQSSPIAKVSVSAPVRRRVTVDRRSNDLRTRDDGLGISASVLSSSFTTLTERNRSAVHVVGPQEDFGAGPCRDAMAQRGTPREGVQ